MLSYFNSYLKRSSKIYENEKSSNFLSRPIIASDGDEIVTTTSNQSISQIVQSINKETRQDCVKWLGN